MKKDIDEMENDFAHTFINKNLVKKDKTRVVDGETFRTCTICKVEKNITEFHKRRSLHGFFGHQGKCKDCSKEYSKKRYDKKKKALVREGK